MTTTVQAPTARPLTPTGTSGPIHLGVTQFRREYELVIGARDGSEVTLSSIGIAKPLTITFSVLMKATNESKMSLGIYNLSETTKALLSQRWTEVELRVGYRGQQLRTIFKGTVTGDSSTTSLKGADYLTTVTVKDGYSLYNVAISGSTKPESCPKEALSRIVNRITIATKERITLGTDIDTLDMLDKKITGFSFVGPAVTVLKDFLYQYDYDFTIIRNKIIISKRGLTSAPAPSSNSIRVLDVESGLLTSPQPKAFDETTPANSPTKTEGSTFRCLLDPTLTPTTYVKVVDPIRKDTEGRPLESIHQIRDVMFKGDYSGTNWYADVTTTRRSST